MDSVKSILVALSLAAFLCGCSDEKIPENVAAPAPEKNYVLAEKIAYADAGVSRETFDFGWKFAKFGKHADCLAKQEPGAPAGVAVASSAEAHNPAGNAFDGNAATRWCASDSNKASLLVDLGRACDVGMSKISWEKAANYRYTIFVSSDGKTWEKLADQSAKTVPAKENAEMLNRNFRYAKIDITPPNKSTWASVREWEFFSNSGAKITPENPKTGPALKAYEVAFDDSGWRKLDLPHDWGVESKFLASEPNQTGSLPWNAVGWYRKEFDVPAEKSGKKFFLDFDGVMMMPQVYVNGELAGEWKYGYSSFRVDITPFLKFGEKNTIAVRAENLPNSTRWYPGAGIYRHVWLVEKNPTYIDYNGIWVKTPEISAVEMRDGKRYAGTAKVTAETTVVKNLKDSNALKVLNEIKKDGRVLAKAEGENSELALTDVELWDIENPALYTLVTTVVADGKVIDRQETVFGVRKSEWKADGYYLNERRVPIQGVCQHHDLGPLGGAVHTRAMERQIEVLKSFGVNAIRTSHNPPAPELLDLCDRMGILVDDELLDCWKHLKEGKTNGYNLFWENWRERDVRNFVMRDRNRPCVIMWSVGNEIEEQHSADGPALAKDLVERFHRYDPTRPTTIGSNDIRASRTNFGKQFDVFGFNYKPNNYTEFATNNPNTPFYGSETCSTVSSRGFYSFPVDEKDFDTAFWRRNFCDSLAACQVSDYAIYA
ncbi:MAG: discoidin domain-containing protein, partial [Opitutales bacterium]|nr:discoidin domain-containing protein [Opitutales bacterium]